LAIDVKEKKREKVGLLAHRSNSPG